MRNTNCELCDLHRSSTHVCVWGLGPKQAKVMFVGEAPGAMEAKTGKPFQGESGQLLRNELKAAGVEPEDVYISNMVKCRPPENRTPTAKEIKTCRGYLDLEIATVNPEIIVLLGATALKLIKKTGITELRGSILEMNGRKYFPMFHPAAALRDPGKLPAIRQDITKLSKLIDGSYEDPEEIDWHTIHTKNLDQFLNEFEGSSYFSFDVETTGLLAQHPDFRVNCIAFTLDNQRSWVLPLNTSRDIEWSEDILDTIKVMAEGKKAIGHNGKFDNNALMARYGFRFHLTFDTMLASHVFDENTPHDLKFLAKVHCGAPDYDDMTVKEKTHPTDLMRLYRYNAMDTYYTVQLYLYYQEKLKRTFKLRRLFYKLVMPVARVMEEADFGGHYIRMRDFEKTKQQLILDVERSRKELDRMSGSRRKINWGSPQQVADLFFNKLGLPVIKNTPGGKPSTDEEVLLELKDLHPIPAKLVEHRGYQKFLSTYILGWEELMVGSYLYISTKLHGTVTGRFSSRLHQVPRDGTIRNLIDAPDGWTFLCADFSQIELRLAADAADETRMKMVFQTGGDIHATTASEIVGIPPEQLTKEQRKMGKPVNFGYLYGMGYLKFIKYAKVNYGVVFTEGQGKANRERYFSMYSKLRDWHDKVRRLVREQGYVEYLSGRLRRLPGTFSQDKEVRAESERQAINSPIQGFGSGDLKAMAMVGIRESFDPDILQIKGEVHDSILMWVKTKYLKPVLPRIKEIMEHPPLFKDFKIELSVPLVVDIDVGTWGKGISWQKWLAENKN